jgi:hypothetical protein
MQIFEDIDVARDIRDRALEIVRAKGHWRMVGHERLLIARLGVLAITCRTPFQRTASSRVHGYRHALEHQQDCSPAVIQSGSLGAIESIQRRMVRRLRPTDRCL